MTDSGIRTALVEPPTVKVADLTGPDTSSLSFGVGGTDLGDTFDDARVGGRRSPAATTAAIPGTAADPMHVGSVHTNAGAHRCRVRADELLDRSAWHAWTGRWLRNRGHGPHRGAGLRRIHRAGLDAEPTAPGGQPLEHHRRVELAVPAMQYRHDTTARL